MHGRNQLPSSNMQRRELPESKSDQNRDIKSKSFHQPLAYSPHASALAVDVQRDGQKEAEKLDSADGEVHRSRAIGLKPVDNEQGPDETVKNVCICQ